MNRALRHIAETMTAYQDAVDAAHETDRLALATWDAAVSEHRVAMSCWHAWSLGAGLPDPMFAHRLMAPYRRLAAGAVALGFLATPSEVGAGL